MKRSNRPCFPTRAVTSITNRGEPPFVRRRPFLCLLYPGPAGLSTAPDQKGRGLCLFSPPRWPLLPSQSRRPTGVSPAPPQGEPSASSFSGPKQVVRRSCFRAFPYHSPSRVPRADTWLPLRDCAAEARPADETAEAEQGQRSAFCKRL